MPLWDVAPETEELELVREPADLHRLRTVHTPAVESLLPRTTLGWAPFVWQRVLFPGRTRGTTGWSWSSLLALAILGALLLFPWMRFPLFEPDEGRYAQIPAEMLARGDWLVPTLQGEPYLDKPPFFYWSVMAAYQIFGVHIWAARLVPALAILGAVLVCYGLGRRLIGERESFWGALMLLLAPGFTGPGRMLVLDGLLTLWVTTSLLGAFLAVRGPRLHLGWWLTASAACGLGVLTKGPVAVALLVVPLLAQRWLAGSICAIGKRGWLVFAGVVLAITAPWYLAVSLCRPEFGGYFFWKHNVLRFLQPFDHERPVWFYLPLLVIGLFPAILLAPAAIRWLLANDEKTSSERCPVLSYLLLAGGWCVFFFSMAGSKLPTYILPAVPSLCMALGVVIVRRGWQRSSWLRGSVAATACAILAGHVWLTPAVARERSPVNAPPEVLAWCRDRDNAVFCFPRNVDSVAFEVGRADFRTYRSKELGDFLEELDRQPRAVVLFAHRNSLDTLRRQLPPHLRIVADRPLGLCSAALIERQAPQTR